MCSGLFLPVVIVILTSTVGTGDRVRRDGFVPGAPIGGAVDISAAA